MKKYESFLLEDQKILRIRHKFDRIIDIANKYVKENFTDDERNTIFAIEDQVAKYEAILHTIKCRLKPFYEVRKFDIEVIVGFLYPKIDSHVSA